MTNRLTVYCSCGASWDAEVSDPHILGRVADHRRSCEGATEIEWWLEAAAELPPANPLDILAVAAEYIPAGAAVAISIDPATGSAVARPARPRVRGAMMEQPLAEVPKDANS